MSSAFNWPAMATRSSMATRGSDMALLRGGLSGDLASPNPVNEGERQQHHPELAQDLPGQEVEAAEGQPQEQQAVGDQPDQAAGQHGEHESTRLQWRIDGEVGELR